MSIKFNNKDIESLKLGTKEVESIYLGTTEMYASFKSYTELTLQQNWAPQFTINNLSTTPIVVKVNDVIRATVRSSGIQTIQLQNADLGQSVRIYSKGPWEYCYDTMGKAASFDCSNELFLQSIGNYAFEGCTSLMDILIPDSVVSIGNYAFRGCSSLTSIIIPDSITSISEGAFYECTGLTSLTIPDSITSIGNYTFYGCSGLTSIAIPASVTSIGESAFYECTGLTSIIIPDSVTSIGRWAFYQCSGLTSLTIPDSVTNMGISVFAFCDNIESYTGILAWIKSETFYSGISTSNLKQVTLLDKISIPANAFSNWSQVQNITILDSVTQIGASAFSGCSGLINIHLPSNLLSIGNSVFTNCTNLTSIIIPESITSIGNWTFAYCNSLTSITIPDSVTSIGEYAFYGCAGLTTVFIPGSVTSIRQQAFADYFNINPLTLYCSAIDTPEGWDADWKALTKDGSSIIWGYHPSVGLAYSENADGTITITGRGTCTDPDSLIIPLQINKKKVTAISENAFRNDTQIYNLILTGNLSSIAVGAFSDCSYLTSVTIPYGIQTIESNAFSACSELVDLKLPTGLKSIGSSAFAGCTQLEDIVLPEGLVSIDSYAFYSCIRLMSITLPSTLTTIEDYAFFDCYKLVEVYNKSNLSITSGQTTYGGVGLYALSIRSYGQSQLNYRSDGFITLGQWLVGYGQQTDSITINLPSNIAIINKYALSNCNYTESGRIPLMSVIISGQITYIRESAFSNNNDLSSVFIPNSVLNIDQNIFNNCPQLTTIKCEASSKPAGWNDNWLGNCTAEVIWGSTPE